MVTQNVRRVHCRGGLRTRMQMCAIAQKKIAMAKCLTPVRNWTHCLSSHINILRKQHEDYTDGTFATDVNVLRRTGAYASLRNAHKTRRRGEHCNGKMSHSRACLDALFFVAYYNAERET